MKGIKRINNQNIWNCGKCRKKYTTIQLCKLEGVKAVESDTNPKEQHGFLSKCTCGYIFHRDKWYMKDSIDVAGIEFEVITEDLELMHGAFRYETVVYLKNWDYKKYENLEFTYQDRYVSKQQAKKGHNILVKDLFHQKFKIVPVKHFKVVI